MSKFNFKVVGLQHKGVTQAFIESLNAVLISFVAEPKNRFDRNAVMCMFRGGHFGYVEKEKSTQVIQILKFASHYSLRITKKDLYEINFELDFETKNVDVGFNALSDGDVSGVYEIKFLMGDTTFRYIGQSININDRLRAHFRELSTLTHHNKIMQSAWCRQSDSFSFKVLERTPVHLSPLDQQFYLFQKEVKHIEEAGIHCVNAIAGDLVFTSDSMREFDTLTKNIKKRISNRRKVLVYEKEKISETILDVGILRREKVSEFEIKASNVLSWINKKRRSVFDYMPPINREHRLYEPLVAALIERQKQIAECDSCKKYIEEFQSNLFIKKNNYDTCEFKSLQQFLVIVDKYKSVPDFVDVIRQYHEVRFGAIAYDSCLNNFLDKKVIEMILNKSY